MGVNKVYQLYTNHDGNLLLQLSLPTHLLKLVLCTRTQESSLCNMHVFYFNIPWIIDPTEYNCSSRTMTEWRERGSVNEIQGIYFLTFGTVCGSLYLLTMVAMVTGKLTRVPCYRLMFFNGITDILDLIAGSLIVSYFHFTGAVFCSSIALNQFAGHLAWSAWFGSTFNCIALALNRVVEMIPSAHGLRFLFRGKSVYVWMVVCVAIMIGRAFVTRPVLYNSAVAAYLAAPVISDDAGWEVTHYTSILLPIHNISVIAILGILYVVLCCYVVKIRRAANGSIDKLQIQLFLQALVICASTAIAAVSYVFVEFVPVPRAIVIMANVTWQFSHGVHGIVYIFLNKLIRTEVVDLLRCKKRSKPFFTSTHTMTVVKGSGH
ncbi:hypothetical protein Y032_0006g3011 [Ancylostoma ceylanicum]|uniref:G-protein coupled receptors family 1 profile domain-containing protein n=1 Tax=Ancylostoma ceylanicum TaxID=53326 RepID=A0A016VQC7_9BILA|nr:hypothetical protein Y032_0006g3011 [Ancylostoma ceylanicum]